MHKNSAGKHDTWMMLGMMACCALLPLLIIVLAANNVFKDQSNLVIIAVMGAFVLIHVLMMRKTCMHGDSNSNKENKKNSNTSTESGKCH